MLGLDRRAAGYAWTVVFVFLLLGLVYLIRETLFIFAVALLFAYLLSPLELPRPAAAGCIEGSGSRHRLCVTGWVAARHWH